MTSSNCSASGTSSHGRPPHSIHLLPSPKQKDADEADADLWSETAGCFSDPTPKEEEDTREPVGLAFFQLNRFPGRCPPRNWASSVCQLNLRWAFLQIAYPRWLPPTFSDMVDRDSWSHLGWIQCHSAMFPADFCVKSSLPYWGGEHWREVWGTLFRRLELPGESRFLKIGP